MMRLGGNVDVDVLQLSAQDVVVDGAVAAAAADDDDDEDSCSSSFSL